MNFIGVKVLPFKVNLSPNVVKSKLKVKHKGGKDHEMT